MYSLREKLLLGRFEELEQAGLVSSTAPSATRTPSDEVSTSSLRSTYPGPPLLIAIQLPSPYTTASPPLLIAHPFTLHST